MRDEWDDDHDDEHGDDEAAALRDRRRRRALIAVTGLAVLGAGAFLVTAQVTDDGATTRDPVALVPVTPAVTPAESVPSAVPSSVAPSSAIPASSSPSAAADAKAVAKEIAEARAAAAEDGVPLKKPVKAEGDSAAAAAAKVVNTGSLRKDRATLRIVSARTDLTGQRELALVADGGEPVGNAFCSQNIKAHAGAEVETNRNLLICWRVSAQKSVYTLAVDLDGNPSEGESVAAIDREWQALG
ncbi:hypothetical protein ACWEOZ_01685 [Actinoplanes sp. NPDC004185]